MYTIKLAPIVFIRTTRFYRLLIFLNLLPAVAACDARNTVRFRVLHYKIDYMLSYSISGAVLTHKPCESFLLMNVEKHRNSKILTYLNLKPLR